MEVIDAAVHVIEVLVTVVVVPFRITLVIASVDLPGEIPFIELIFVRPQVLVESRATSCSLATGG